MGPGREPAESQPQPAAFFPSGKDAGCTNGAPSDKKDSIRGHADTQPLPLASPNPDPFSLHPAQYEPQPGLLQAAEPARHPPGLFGPPLRAHAPLTSTA